MRAPGLDFGVGVDEGQAEPGGKALAHGGLAGAHHADQHDRAPVERAGGVFASGDSGSDIKRGVVMVFRAAPP